MMSVQGQPPQAIETPTQLDSSTVVISATLVQHECTYVESEMELHVQTKP